MPEWHMTQPWCIACYHEHLPRKDRNARPAEDEECCMCARQLDKDVTVMALVANPKYPTITADGERVPVVG